MPTGTGAGWRSSCAGTAARPTSSRPRRPHSSIARPEFLELMLLRRPTRRPDSPTWRARRLFRRASRVRPGRAGGPDEGADRELRDRRVLLAPRLRAGRRRREPRVGPLPATEAGEQRLGDDEAKALGRDYLHEGIAQRLRAGKVAFDLRLQLAGPGRPSTTRPPSGRRTPRLVEAGRLELTAIAEDPERDGHIDVFDPTRVATGSTSRTIQSSTPAEGVLGLRLPALGPRLAAAHASRDRDRGAPGDRASVLRTRWRMPRTRNSRRRWRGGRSGRWDPPC